MRWPNRQCLPCSPARAAPSSILRPKQPGITLQEHRLTPPPRPLPSPSSNSLAADLTGSGVRVNSILPSIIDTEANRQAMPKADFSKWPKPEDIAEVVLFLASDLARVIHGATIPVFGNA